MEEQIKRQLIKSKVRADRSFFGKNGFRIMIRGCGKDGEGGENWIEKEEVDYLLEKSKAFRAFIQQKQLVVKTGDNAVRAETKEEEKHRLTLLDKAKAMAKKVLPKKKDEDSEANDADLETFQQSLKDENQKELSLFKDALRTASVDQQKASVDELKNTMKLSVDVEKGAWFKLLSDKHKEVLKAFEESIDETLLQKTEAFEKKATEMLDQIIQNRTKSFEKNLKKISSQVLKQNP